MKRYITIITLLAAVGCGDANPQAGTGGFGGTAGMGGAAGFGGTAGMGGAAGMGGSGGVVDLCMDVDCDDGNGCTEDLCDPADGTCDNPPVTDGTACNVGGVCTEGVCEDPSGWFWQNPLPQGDRLNGVSFVDATTGTAVGWGGTIVRTTNGGTTWAAQNSGTTEELWGVSFANANTGTAVGDNGTIVRTTDGGGG